ncbi:MAG TPA: hypothetical protein VGV38_06250 [Pyrinomonadaceae bacterium]|nr:hypothetical protein [Pyrinomonadaceae bacterium]
MLTSVDSVLNSALWYDGIIKDGVSPAELEGTREESSYLVRALEATPHEKLEALVARYDPELTEHLNKFQGEWQKDRLAGFRDAQIMIGFVTTIFNEAGIQP